jgi:trk system potassium uptake protein TrkA
MLVPCCRGAPKSRLPKKYLFSWRPDAELACRPSAGKQLAKRRLRRLGRVVAFDLVFGRPGRELAGLLLAPLVFRGKIIERDTADCEELAARLEGVTVLNTRGTDIETLKNEGLERGDVFIAVTQDDQSNILCSLLAKRHGVRRAIALVNQPEYVNLAPTLGIDFCISPRLATASAILKSVRQSGVVSMAMLEQSDSEVTEFLLPGDSRILQQPLKSLAIPEGAIVGAIVRGNEAIVPSGDDHFEVGDHVVVFSLPESVSAVAEFFS